MKIEKLTYYSTSPDCYHWIKHPTNDDIVDKINEIIDHLNGEVKDDETRGER